MGGAVAEAHAPGVVVAEARDLLHHGASPWDVCRTLGIQFNSVLRAATRAGADDVVEAFQLARKEELDTLRPPRTWSKTS